MIPACTSSLFCIHTKPVQWQTATQTALRKLLSILQARTHAWYLQTTLKSACSFFVFFFFCPKRQKDIFVIKTLIVCSSSQQFFQIHEYFSVTSVTANSLIQFHLT